MVLDSNADITTSLPINFTRQAEDFQYNLDNIIAPYAELNQKLFNLGDAKNVQNIFPALNNSLKLIVRNSLYATLFTQSQVNDSVQILAAAKFVNKLLQDNFNASLEQLNQKIDDNQFSSDIEINENIKKIARAQINDYELQKNQLPQAVKFTDAMSTNLAVKCNDTSSPTDFNFWYLLSNELSNNALVFGGSAIQNNCTSQWGGAVVKRPSITNMRNAPPVLMLQAQYDGATPLQNAITTFISLQTANMVYVTNSYDHGLFFNLVSTNNCVDNIVTDYLLGKKLDSQIQVCNGNGVIPNMNILNHESKELRLPKFKSVLKVTQTYNQHIVPFKAESKVSEIKKQIRKIILDSDLILNSSRME